MRVLVTGATGTLGRPLVRAIRSAGHDVRALSRREQASAEGIEWIRGDLTTGEGIAASVEGVSAIVHAATLGGFAGGKARMRYSIAHPKATDVAGTRRLLEAALEEGIAHVVYVSIVGIDQVPAPYFKHKIEAERIVAESGVPFTIARATQFHEFVDAVVRYALRFPVPLITGSWRTQPIDAGDAASLIARHVDASPLNDIVNHGGPEAMTLGEAAGAWVEARGVRRRIRNMAMPGRAARALSEGALCTEDRSGTITWRAWLRANPKEG